MSTTLVARPAPGHPAPLAVRVVPAPRSEPPTDDQLAAAGLDAPPMAALLLPLDLPGTLLPRIRQRKVPAETSQIVAEQPETPERPAVAVAEPVAALEVEQSPARIATRRFLATCLEVIGGFRPLSQLRPLCLPDRFPDIAERLAERPGAGPTGRSRGLAHLAAAARTPLVQRASGAPPRAGRANQTSPGDRVSVRRVQLCEASDGVAEVAVVLTRRDEVWAMALRLECRRGSWLCTDLLVL